MYHASSLLFSNMSQGPRSPSFARKYRSKFYKNFANYSTYFCDGCLLRNFSGPLFNCQSCNNFGVCQTCISDIKRFHDPSHNFALEVSKDQVKLANTGITCHGCSTPDFTGVRYNCQQCLDPFDLCQRCIPQASSLHVRGHTFAAVLTPDNKISHASSVCDGCQKKPIVGVRYKCLSCSNYDLCSRCWWKNLDGKIHDVTHKFQAINASGQQSNHEQAAASRASQAIARIRAIHGPEYNGNAVDAETGWNIADARIQEQQAFQLAMMRTQIQINHAQNVSRILSNW